MLQAYPQYRAEMVLLGVKNRDLAQVLNVSGAYVSAMLNGNSNLPEKYECKIVQYLKEKRAERENKVHIKSVPGSVKFTNKPLM